MSHMQNLLKTELIACPEGGNCVFTTRMTQRGVTSAGWVYTEPMALDPTQELARTQRLLAEAETQVEVLRMVVNIWKQAAKGDVAVGGIPSAEAVGTATVHQGAPPRPGRQRAKQGTGLKAILAEVMEDGQRRDVEAVIKAVDEGGFYDALPKRVSFTNRLHDLVTDGYLLQIKRGVYERASANGSADAESLTAEGIPSPDARWESPSTP
jgi:hypothetical protein